MQRRSQKRKVRGIAAFTGSYTENFPLFDLQRFTSLKTAKFFIGILLIPLCWISLECFLLLFHAEASRPSFWRSPEVIAFGLGAAFWLVLFFGLRSRFLMWLYVAGHELTHAIFVLLCKGRVTKVHISAEGGHILTNRNNFLISLSPYFFPFYSAIVILVWAVLEWLFFDFQHHHLLWLYGLIGLTWTFHISFTIYMIRHEQPDVLQNGKLFSFALITLMNVLLIAAMMIVASPRATFRGFAQSFVANTESFVHRFAESCRELWSILPM